MKISTVLDHIDSGHMALPEFQRGYVWNRDQVRGLFESLYRHHPVGSLLVWITQSSDARHRGEGERPPGAVKLLLDGQQRMTSIYGVIRGAPPQFFQGNDAAFTGLRFHLGDETFEFYQPIKMRDDPLWIDVTDLMQKGNEGLGKFIAQLGEFPDHKDRIGEYVGRLSRILGIKDIDFHVDEVTGQDKTIDVVVDIFNRVNSGGTKLSKGDLALAKICAEWPEARKQMRAALNQWNGQGFNFNLDWLLRNLNTILTGEAKFLHLHDIGPERIQDGLERTIKRVDEILNMIGGRLGLDHDRVLFGRFAIPVLANYLDRRGGQMDAVERDRMLFWFAQAGMWGRFSGSTESYIDQDLAAVEEVDGGLDRLIGQLRLWHGGLRVEPGHFSGWSLGARFYPVLYMLTRVGKARDWGTGLPMKENLLGKMSKLEVHHIFPKSVLYKADYTRPEVNAIANFCFLTKDTNLQIGASRPEDYFPEIESKYPGALFTQWIPRNPELWKLENYRAFLEARRQLLADAANAFMTDLLHGDTEALAPSEVTVEAAPPVAPPLMGGVDSAAEEELLLDLNRWVADQGLPEANYLYDLADEKTGAAIAVLDLAWPDGLQVGLSQPAVVLIDEGPEVLACANRAGFRCFTSIEDFKTYVVREVLVQAPPEAAG
ncbi:MAG: DUF262 domain-containing protein [Proteobacteria bacterium]|nr:DUF262 domain-containing protein [Pseudomonadota bacterium]